MLVEVSTGVASVAIMVLISGQGQFNRKRPSVKSVRGGEAIPQ